MARASATPPAQYKAQFGTPDQMPMGEAGQLNAAVSAIPDAGQEEALPAPEVAKPSDYEPQFQPASDEEAFLTDPTMFPGEDVSTGAGAGSQAAMPSDVRHALPTFLEAASHPDAPASLKALAQLLQRYS